MQESELLIDFLFPFAADRITSVSLVANGEGRQSTPTDSLMNVLRLQGHSFFLFSLSPDDNDYTRQFVLLLHANH